MKRVRDEHSKSSDSSWGVYKGFHDVPVNWKYVNQLLALHAQESSSSEILEEEMSISLELAEPESYFEAYCDGQQWIGTKNFPIVIGDDIEEVESASEVKSVIIIE